MNARHRLIAAVAALALTVSGASGCSEYQKLRKGVDQLSHPAARPRPLTDEQKIKLIDSMRGKGSFEAARDRLTVSAQSIAEQIATAVPGRKRGHSPTTPTSKTRIKTGHCVAISTLTWRVAPEPEPLSSVRRSPRMDSLPPLGSSVRKPPNMAPRNRARCSMSPPSGTTTCRATATSSTSVRSRSQPCSSPAIASCFRKFSTHHPGSFPNSDPSGAS